MNTYIVTHFIDIEPSRHGLSQIPFITMFQGKYFNGFEQQRAPIPSAEMSKSIAENFCIPLAEPQIISQSQTVWISPESEVFIGNEKNPFDQEKIILREKC